MEENVYSLTGETVKNLIMLKWGKNTFITKSVNKGKYLQRFYTENE